MMWLDEHFERLKEENSVQAAIVQIVKITLCACGTLLLNYANGRIEVIRR